MNGESIYVPNFVLNGEESASAEQKEFEAEINPSQSTEIKNPISNKLIKREVEFIEKQRNKLRLFDPKGVYFYRHGKTNYLQSILHLLSLLVSCYLIYSVINFYFEERKEFISGIGWVSNTTPIGTITNITILIIVFIQLRRLFKSQGLTEIKRYRLAMLSNTINRFVLSLCTFLLLFMVIYLFDEVNKTLLIWENLENGVLADVIDGIFCFCSIFIVMRSFRFCRKELAE